jgi:hypothetical protein
VRAVAYLQTENRLWNFKTEQLWGFKELQLCEFQRERVFKK